MAQQFFAAVIDGSPISPIFGVGLTRAEALTDAQGASDPTREKPHRFSVYPCSAQLYYLVADYGGDVVWWENQNGTLVVGGEAV